MYTDSSNLLGRLPAVEHRLLELIWAAARCGAGPPLRPLCTFEAERPPRGRRLSIHLFPSPLLLTPAPLGLH